MEYSTSCIKAFFPTIYSRQSFMSLKCCYFLQVNRPIPNKTVFLPQEIGLLQVHITHVSSLSGIYTFSRYRHMSENVPGVTSLQCYTSNLFHSVPKFQQKIIMFSKVLKAFQKHFVKSVRESVPKFPKDAKFEKKNIIWK